MLLPLNQRHCINSQIKSVYSVSFRLLLQYLNQIQIQGSHFRRFLLFVLLYWHLYHNGKYVKEFWEFDSRSDSDFRVMRYSCMHVYIVQCSYVYVCSDLVSTRWRHFDYVYYTNVHLINSNYLFSYVFHTISKSVHCKLLWLNAAKKPIKFDCPNKQWKPSQQVWPALMVRNYDWISKTVHLKATHSMYAGLQMLWTTLTDSIIFLSMMNYIPIVRYQ